MLYTYLPAFLPSLGGAGGPTPADMLVGIALTIAGTFMQSLQYVYEEKVPIYSYIFIYIYMYICVCVCVCMCVCVYIYKYNMYIYICAHYCRHLHAIAPVRLRGEGAIYEYIFVYICIYICVYIYVCLCAYIKYIYITIAGTFMQSFQYVYEEKVLGLFIHIYMNLYLYIYICIYTYIYIYI